MFFVNGDLHQKDNTKSLSEVINDTNSKVAYGVLSLKSFYRMVKQIGGNEKIFIPKVQRGLVWKDSDKSSFIENCIRGRKDGIKEPMPNIFLFYDMTTKELQLFDGLQRTSAILKEFNSVNDIDSSDDVMVPTALFKGERTEAEKLFRNINEKGVKLNDFEKLASQGGEFEIELSKLDNNIYSDFSRFVKDLSESYSEVGLTTSSNEMSTLYELLVYAIYKFSNTQSAISIFDSENSKGVNEWGYQLVYSTLTAEKTKSYTSAKMLSSTMNDFAGKVSYNREQKTFNIEKLDSYIRDMNDAVIKAQKTIKDIYMRNINSRNKKNFCKKALKSKSLIGSLVVASYIKPDWDKNAMYLWFLKQLIDGAASKSTNTIVDKLIAAKDERSVDIEESLKRVVWTVIQNQEFKNQDDSLWHLFYLQNKFIREYDITFEFDIDHIIPQKILKDIYGDKDAKSMSAIHNIANLAIVPREWNNKKKAKTLTYIMVNNAEDFDEIKLRKYYAFNDEKKFKDLLKIMKLFDEEYKNGNFKMAKTYYEAFLEKRKGQLEEELGY